MPTVSVNASGLGFIQGNALPVWFDARNETIAGGAFDLTAGGGTYNGVYVEYGSGRSGPLYQIIRSYFYWDLQAYAGSITSIDMTINLVGIGSPLVIQPAQSTLAFGGLPPSIPLDVDQYDINTPTPPAPPVYGPTFNNGGPATVTLNAQALSDANSNGFLIVQLDEYDFDYSDIDPTPFGTAVYSAAIDFSLAGNYLDVTYTTGYANEVNNVAGASISEVIGVAGASIGEIMNT